MCICNMDGGSLAYKYVCKRDLLNSDTEKDITKHLYVN